MIIPFNIEEQILFLKENEKAGKGYASCIISCIKNAVKNKIITKKTADEYALIVDSIINKKLKIKQENKDKISFNKILKEAENLSYEIKVIYLANLLNHLLDSYYIKQISKEQMIYYLENVYKVIPYEELKHKLKYQL